MARASRRAKPQPQAPGDFTDQLRAGPDWTDARVVVMPGERREALNTRRRQSPAISWHAGHAGHAGFLTKRQAAALVIYAGAWEDAGYGAVKSCLAEPTGPGGDTSAERQFARRQRLAQMRNSVTDQAALIFTHEALFPYGSETLDDLAERLIAGSRAHRRDMARAFIVLVAEAMAAWIEAGEK